MSAANDKMKSLKKVILIVILIVCLCFIQGTTADKHMLVSGRVINLETGKGI